MFQIYIKIHAMSVCQSGTCWRYSDHFLKTYPPQCSNVIIKWSLTDTAILQKIWQKIVYDFSPPFKSVFNLVTRIV